MNNVKNLTSLDPDQIVRYSYDEESNASRVVIVGSDLSDFKEQLKQSLQNIFPVETSQVQVQTENKPVVQVEYREIEKPIIIKEKDIEIKEIEKQVPIIVEKIEYREIEKPILIKEIQYLEVEKPIIVEKEKFLEIPSTIKIYMGIQFLIVIGLLIALILK